MRAEHRALAARWFERLLDLLPVDARDIFPSQSLLDHVPALILEISEYLRHPEDDAKEALGHIFQRFTRAHTHRDDVPHVGGLGLGLSIVADCVAAIGGVIDVNSTEGEGTTFVLRVPTSPR